MADGRDLMLGPGGLTGFTVHLEAEPNPGTRRLMDWLGVEIDVTAAAQGMAICLVGGCGWHWDGQGERHEAIEQHRAAEHDYIPAHRFSVRSHLNGAEGYDIDVGPADGRAALDAMDAGLPQRPAESKQEVETVRGGVVKWPREAIIEAIQAFHAEHGRPPKADEWIKSSPDHPTQSTVNKHFGSWAAAIEAAGYERPKRGGTAGNTNRSSVREPKAREAGAVLVSPPPVDVKQPGATGDDAVRDEPPSPAPTEAGSRTDEYAEWLASKVDVALLTVELDELDRQATECQRKADALRQIVAAVRKLEALEGVVGE